MYLTSSGRGFLPLVSWDQAVSSAYIVLTAAYSIQGKEEECMIHIRGVNLSVHNTLLFERFMWIKLVKIIFSFEFCNEVDSQILKVVYV